MHFTLASAGAIWTTHKPDALASSLYPHFLTQTHSMQLQNDMSRGPAPQKSQYHPSGPTLPICSIGAGRGVVHASHDFACALLMSVHVSHDHSPGGKVGVDGVERLWAGRGGDWRFD